MEDRRVIIGITAVIVGLLLPILRRPHLHWAAALLIVAGGTLAIWAVLVLALNVANIRD